MSKDRRKMEPRGVINCKSRPCESVSIAGPPETVLEAALAACEAAMRYDASICGRAIAGEVDLHAAGATAEGDDLDALYFDWQEKAKLALKMAGRTGT